MGLCEAVYDWGLIPLERLGLATLRRRLLTGIPHQTALEVGVGTGLGLQAYAPGQAVVGLDPQRPALERARHRALRRHHPLLLVQGDAQALPFGNATFGLVVFQLVLCTIPEPLRALGEVYRVLRPGGSLVALEHVRSPRQPLAWVQHVITPLWKHLAGGCHLNRDTVALVKRAGFALDRLERYLGGVLVILRATKTL
ncbi:MAG: methyltransferase domain-containing protein [Dehalococcoidia bacterium]|nr:methyltransferase domain-containing protein [Dehalococcoidia bacterium]MDW8119617.1 methyltransferase domain-containing protein [Chloroflexota bacterium]